jgi:hypothetical protein
MSLETTQDVYVLFSRYNRAIWPMIIIAYILAILMITLTIKKKDISDKLISIILAFITLWIGIVLYLIFTLPLDPFWSVIFGIVWIIQAILFLYFGVYKSSLSFKFEKNSYSIIGALMILYALLMYPLIQIIIGHDYPVLPFFGVVPCPSTVFIFGILLMTDKKVPKTIVIIPLCFSIITGLDMVFSYQFWVDLGLITSGILGSILIYYRNSKEFSN